MSTCETCGDSCSDIDADLPNSDVCTHGSSDSTSDSRSDDGTSPSTHTIVASDATTPLEIHEGNCYEMATEELTWMAPGYQDASGAWEHQTWWQPTYMWIPVDSIEFGYQVDGELLQECAPASQTCVPSDEVATSSDGSTQDCDPVPVNASSADVLATSNDDSIQNCTDTANTAMIAADMPKHPPGVFFTGCPYYMYNLYTGNSVVSDCMFNDEYYCVNDDWQSGNSMSLSSVAETTNRAKRRNAPVYIATHLTWLETKDSDCVCIVRKIQKLGARVTDVLREHFEQWGAVEKVLLSCQPAEGEGAAAEAGETGRKKSPCMGWVVMEDARDAAQVLAQGLHQIGSTTVQVERFVSKNAWQKQPKTDALMQGNKLCAETELEEDFELDEMLSDMIAGKRRARWSDMSPC